MRRCKLSWLSLAAGVLLWVIPSFAQRDEFSEPSFQTKFGSADTVLVGTVVSGRRVSRSDPRFNTPAVKPFPDTPIYLCEVTVRVKATLKPRNSLTVGSRIDVLWYLPSKACEIDFPEQYRRASGEDLLLFVRAERNFQRSLMDNFWTAFTVEHFSPEIAQKLAKWKDPKQAAAYLVLTPGTVIADQFYYRSRLPWEIAAMLNANFNIANFLNIYRQVYLDASPNSRGHIAVQLFGLDMCVDMALRSAIAEGRLKVPVRRPTGPFDDPMVIAMDPDIRRQRDEDTVSTMSWTTKGELLASSKSQEEAIDDLTTRACSSSPKTRQRGRELLERYFGIKAA